MVIAMQTPYVIMTLEQAESLLDVGEVLAFDVETTIKKGKYSKICSAQFYQSNLDEAIIVRNPDPIALMMLIDKFHWIAHYARYEVTTMQRQTGLKYVPKRWDCTFLMTRLVYYKEESFTLDDMMEKVLGFCPYAAQGIDKSIMQKSDFDVPSYTDEQCRYAACDVYNLIRVYNSALHILSDTSYIVDKSFSESCFKFQTNGMPVSQEKLLLKYEQNLKDIAALKLGTMNPNSYIQVRRYLDSTGSDDEALARMHVIDGNEKAGNVRKARKLLKQNSFLTKFDTTDGRIYGTFGPSARSGRCTSDDQNLQQLPRSLKGIFEAPPGRILVYADYAQIELRSICAITGCTRMEELFRAVVDLHSYTRDFIFGTVEETFKLMMREIEGFLTVEEQENIRHEAEVLARRNRQITKTCNFNFLYAGGVPVLLKILLVQASINMSEPDGMAIRKKWRKLWKEIFGWQQKGISEWNTGKCGSTALGRRYKARLLTDHLNMENQGSSAEVAKLAQHYLEPRLEALRNKHQTDIMVCNFIHDSWILECDDNDVVYSEVCVELAKSMQEAWFEMSKLFKIKDLPMPVNVKCGYNWGDIENDDVPNVYEYNLEGMDWYANI